MTTGVRPTIAAPAAALGEIIFTATDIARAVEAVAARIRSDFAGEPFIMVSVLKGAAVFTADLMRALGNYPLTVDYMVVASYGTGRTDGSSPDVRILKDLDRNPA